MCGGLRVPFAYSSTAKETLCPLRAGNSAMLAFNALKVVGGSDPTKERMPVNVKKFPSIMVTFGLVKKSERISGSPAVVTWMMANEEIISEKNLREKTLEAIE